MKSSPSPSQKHLGTSSFIRINENQPSRARWDLMIVSVGVYFPPGWRIVTSLLSVVRTSLLFLFAMKN